MKKKLSIIMPGLGDSGGIRVIKKYKELLENMGWDVVIFCPIKAYNLHRYKSNCMNFIHSVYCTMKTLREIKRKKYCKWVWNISNKSVRDADCVMATMWATAFDVAKLDSNKGKKFYFIQDYEIWDNKELAQKSYFLPLEKITISSWINDRIKKDLNIGPYPIVYNGIDTSVFKKKDICKKDISCVHFLMLNHSMPKKGVMYGLKVFEKINMKFRDCKLSMFGMCDNGNIPSYVEYYQNPSKDKLVELYSSSDIFIFPSIEEGWGLTPLEAMACGCVVVGTRTGFVLDIGKNRENMMISDPGDVDGMVKNITELLENKQLYNYVRSNSRKLIESLNWKDSARELVSILENDNQL